MNRYENGKIYIITDTAYTKFYYGSTCEELSKRLWRHKSFYNDYLKGKTYYKNLVCNLFEEFGKENCKIELIEKYPCECKEELLAREGHYIKNNDCVNKCVACRTPQEYYQDNKDKYAEWNKEWHKNNKEKTAQRKKEYHQQQYQCECGAVLCLGSKSHHKNSKGHQDWLNKQNEE